jgi:uroporphyrinogen-III synthase
MRILFLRPEGSNIPKVDFAEVINIPIFSPICIDYPSLPLTEAYAFTSSNAVKCFHDFDKIKGKQIFSIGKSTAKELMAHEINSLYPPNYDSLDLADFIKSKGIKSLTAIRSKKASNDLKNSLQNIEYHEIYDYDTIINKEELEKSKDYLENCKIDLVVLTSSEIAKAVASSLKNCYKIVSIGPMTTKTILSLRPDLKIFQSKIYDIEGVIDLIKREVKFQ